MQKFRSFAIRKEGQKLFFLEATLFRPIITLKLILNLFTDHLLDDIFQCD